MLEEENRSADEVLGIKIQEKNHGGTEESKWVDGPRKESRTAIKEESEEVPEGATSKTVSKPVAEEIENGEQANAVVVDKNKSMIMT
ncbi:hypothetical protein CR513_21780, partial [Mucuna pruriens]